MDRIEVKQVIVVRNDLKMRKGKIAAQCSHASMKVFFDIMRRSSTYDCPKLGEGIFSNEIPVYSMYPTKDMDEWIQGIFAKTVLKVQSEEELDELTRKAEEAGLPNSVIVDAGRTVFEGVPTKTCIAIGPAKCEEIDKITGHLKLL